MKLLYKSEKNKVVSGVIGGLGEYYNIDPTILRLGFIVLAIFTQIIPAVIGYVIVMLIVPKKPEVHHMHHSEKHEHSEHKHQENKEKKEESKQE